MNTIATELKSPTVLAIERTEKLLHELKRASDAMELKDAIMSYISDIDCGSDCEDAPFVLGDADFAHLFVQSLDRRGKTPIETWASMMILGAQLEHLPEVQRLIRQVHKKNLES